jgi:hypothetical protein
MDLEAQFEEYVDSSDEDVAEDLLDYRDDSGLKMKFKPNARFEVYSKLFTNLLQENDVATMYPIQTMAMTQDSTRAITVTKRDDCESYVKMYNMQTQELSFEEKIGGGPEQFIRVKEVE